ncbi:oligosaccharide repeat unit polymerase [Eisenbergiella porci]|uniref:oligosaccharide repeat unit polymerase n=1 Tax=Eisenbergiella porci TaxID=2652274 RepID=UPI002A7F2FD8|nr:oligosaccharide repeat unit polymerase [Eisenbergiella porci]
MYIYLLLLCEFALLLVGYELFDRDIFAPPVITTIVFCIATILVIPSIELWNVKISTITILVIFVGISSCIVASMFAKILFGKKNISTDKRGHIRYINCHKSVRCIIIFISCILTVLYFIEAIRVGEHYGGTGFGAIGYMKDAYVNQNVNVIRMNIFIRQGFKFVMAISYISSFVFANNFLVLHSGVKDNLYNIISIFCGCAITIFSGSRTDVIRIISAIIISYSFLQREYFNWRVQENSKQLLRAIKKFLPLLIAAAAVAFASKNYVKVKGTGGSEISTIIGYLSFYLGSPIQVLNTKLAFFNGVKELLFGTEQVIPTFVYLGELDYGGNVATILNACFRFNGVIRMSIYLSVVYFIGTAFYYRLYGSRSSYKRNLKLIIFSFVYFIFTMSYYADCSMMLFQFSNIFVILLIVILYKPFMRLQIKLK